MGMAVILVMTSWLTLSGDIRQKLTFKDQRTSGPVNANLISWPSKAQNIQNLESFHKKFGSDQQDSS